jgi:hypothetical protein
MLRSSPVWWIDSCPVSCGGASSRHRHRPDPAVGSAPGAPTVTAWPRSSSWLALPRHGSYCRPRSGAAAQPRPAGGGWTSGPRLGCSTNSRCCCWTSSAPPAASTWRASASTASACGRSKGDLTGANPVDRGKARSKVHVAGDRSGLPLSVVMSGANDHRRCRAYLRRRGVRPRIARRVIESSVGLGRHRWTIERTWAWLGRWRRLRIGYERSSERFYAVVLLACAVICFNTLQQPPWQSFAVSGSSGWQEQQLRSLGASADRVGRSLAFRSWQQATQRWPVACVG